MGTMPLSILPALALLVTLLRGKGFAASRRAVGAVQALCQAGLAQPSQDGWTILLTPQGEDIAKILDARRLSALRIKRQEAYQRWYALDQGEVASSQEVRQALDTFEWYDHCMMRREHLNYPLTSQDKLFISSAW